MKKKHLFIFLGFVVFLMFVYFLSNWYMNYNIIKEGNVCPQICFGENFSKKCFFVELAITPEEKMMGLKGRDELPFNRGILFVYDTDGYYNFWMKDTLIPLDIIWINMSEDNYDWPRGEIVYIKEFAQPLNETPIEPRVYANSVLELNGGTIEANNISKNDRVYRSVNYC